MSRSLALGKKEPFQMSSALTRVLVLNASETSEAIRARRGPLIWPKPSSRAEGLLMTVSMANCKRRVSSSTLMMPSRALTSAITAAGLLMTSLAPLVKAAKKIMKMGPKYLIIKKGEHGALLFHNTEVFFAPALPLEEVFDPTGAGDTFAGGFIGHIAKTKDISFNNMKTAIIVGSAMASFCVEKFGTQRLREINKADIDSRIAEFVQLVNFDINLV